MSTRDLSWQKMNAIQRKEKQFEEFKNATTGVAASLKHSSTVISDNDQQHTGDEGGSNVEREKNQKKKKKTKKKKKKKKQKQQLQHEQQQRKLEARMREETCNQHRITCKQSRYWLHLSIPKKPQGTPEDDP